MTNKKTTKHLTHAKLIELGPMVSNVYPSQRNHNQLTEITKCFLKRMRIDICLPINKIETYKCCSVRSNGC